MRVQHQPLLLEHAHLLPVHQTSLVVHPLHQCRDHARHKERHDAHPANSDQQQQVDPGLQSTAVSLARYQLARGGDLELVAVDPCVEEERALDGGVGGTAGRDDGEGEEDGEVGGAEGELEVCAEGAGKVDIIGGGSDARQVGLDVREDLHADDGEDGDEDEEEYEAAEAYLQAVLEAGEDVVELGEGRDEGAEPDDSKDERVGAEDQDHAPPPVHGALDAADDGDDEVEGGGGAVEEVERGGAELDELLHGEEDHKDVAGRGQAPAVPAVEGEEDDVEKEQEVDSGSELPGGGERLEHPRSSLRLPLALRDEDPR
mmetsp:Transcript_18271/g.60029  ORF Transcript_18271/g.60029 Transcript_18271/m.60029 type:complete len:316 (-) Transcript_18271:4004-4951(-)